MDDKYDLRSLFVGEESFAHKTITSLLEGTPLEESSSVCLNLRGDVGVSWCHIGGLGRC